MLEMIGRIMIVRTTIAVKMLEPVLAGPNSGMNPSAEWSAGITSERSTGPSTMIPQSPITTLGIAASVSTSAVTGPRIQRGASSVRKSAMPIASGVARSKAPSEVTAVPKRKTPAPRWLWTVSQPIFQRKLIPKVESEGRAPSTTL
jgi:hypothetical protein